MYSSHVITHQSTSNEPLITNLTLEGSFPGMTPQMNSQRKSLSERCVTLVALERFLLSVYPHVGRQVRFRHETFPANFADERFLPRVQTLMDR